MFEPQSQLILLNSEIENYNHQLDFSSIMAQTEYWQSRRVKTLENYTFIRKDGIIRCNANIDTLYNCNYLMYQNRNFSNKWFYAFITKLEYVSPDVTAIYTEQDCFQTWQFDLTYRNSFIVREHIRTDTVGGNLVPERVELGQIIEYSANSAHLSNPDNLCVAFFASKQVPIAGVELNPPSKMNGNLCSCYWQVYNLDVASEMVKYLIDAYSIEGASESVVSIFLVPKQFVDSLNVGNVIAIPNSGTNGGYRPRNNKLLTYPYRSVKLTWGNDTSELKYEFMNDTSIRYYGTFEPNPSGIAYPTNYLNVSNNVEYALNISGFPLCPYQTNAYANWLAQTKVSRPLGFLNSAVQAVGGVANLASGNIVSGLGSVVSGATSALSEVANQLDEKYQRSLNPNKVGATISNSSALTTSGQSVIKVVEMALTSEYARKIDKFFDMFGYATNELKAFDFKSRPNWNYIKVIEPIITADIPLNDLNVVKAMFENGTTIWHNPQTFLDYSKPNK